MTEPVSTQSPIPDFASLVVSISEVHRSLAEQAARAVNVSLTLRNWLVGAHIREFEQRGADRAQYGEALFERLSQALAATGAVSYHPRELRRCRAFYLAYPEIRGTLSPELAISPQRLVQSLSFSHFAELLAVEEPLKRRFYEIECLRGNWSVRELKRQIFGMLHCIPSHTPSSPTLLPPAHPKGHKGEGNKAPRPQAGEGLG